MISYMHTPKIPPMPHLPSMPPRAIPSSPSNETPHASVEPKKVEPSMASQQSEPVSLSPIGQEIRQYTKAMADIPDIRKERITQIQAALKKGAYSISSQDLADKLIQEISSLPPAPSSSSA
ncbi:MAG: flagellar biosynthesis anti-sigma factor FlgM [Nitrospirales bacterium]|nr:MAG: flagellar biosynthesis anti-sigma factor FlgM [Nitrospirales bacterium]